MDPKIASLYNENILAAARERYGIAAEKIKLLDGFESFMYEFNRPDGEYILRIGHSSRRTPDLIRGEVDWINTLANNGVTVARAIMSDAGQLVELIDDGQEGQFLCTAFVKAKGAIAGKEQINEILFRNYGHLMGKMHAAAKIYVPADPSWRRFTWDDPENITLDHQLGQVEKIIQEKFKKLFLHLRSLPCDPDGYGIIHQDAHLANLFVDENYTITLFDFDDCVYGHFIYDIAMVLFYISMWGRDDPTAFTRRFMPVFFEGYREYNRLDPSWLKELPNFLKLREIDLFAAILYTMGENPENAWSARYMQGRRARIENDVPYITFDWESLAEYM